jgi:hypothetical protein
VVAGAVPGCGEPTGCCAAGCWAGVDDAGGDEAVGVSACALGVCWACAHAWPAVAAAIARQLAESSATDLMACVRRCERTSRDISAPNFMLPIKFDCEASPNDQLTKVGRRVFGCTFRRALPLAHFRISPILFSRDKVPWLRPFSREATKSVVGRRAKEATDRCS